MYHNAVRKDSHHASWFLSTAVTGAFKSVIVLYWISYFDMYHNAPHNSPAVFRYIAL